MKHMFNRIRQVAPICTSSIAFARWHQRARRHSAVICAKTAEPIDLPFGLWTLVVLGRRKHKLNHIRQVAPIGITWGIQLNCPSVVAMRPYVKFEITLTTCCSYTPCEDELFYCCFFSFFTLLDFKKDLLLVKILFQYLNISNVSVFGNMCVFILYRFLFCCIYSLV